MQGSRVRFPVQPYIFSLISLYLFIPPIPTIHVYGGKYKSQGQHLGDFLYGESSTSCYVRHTLYRQALVLEATVNGWLGFIKEKINAHVTKGEEPCQITVQVDLGLLIWSTVYLWPADFSCSVIYIVPSINSFNTKVINALESTLPKKFPV